MTVPQRWLVIAGGVTGGALTAAVVSLLLPLHGYLIDANIGLSSLSVWAWLKWDASRKATKKRKRIGLWDN